MRRRTVWAGLIVSMAVGGPATGADDDPPPLLPPVGIDPDPSAAAPAEPAPTRPAPIVIRSQPGPVRPRGGPRPSADPPPLLPPVVAPADAPFGTLPEILVDPPAPAIGPALRPPVDRIGDEPVVLERADRVDRDDPPSPAPSPPPPPRRRGLLSTLIPGRRGASIESHPAPPPPRRPTGEGPLPDPVADAALRAEIEQAIRRSEGDRLSGLEVLLVDRRVHVRARASRFWQKKAVRRSIEAHPAIAGFRATVEVE